MNSRRSIKPMHAVIPQGHVIATFPEYQEALVYVERLVSGDFPAGMIAIVGNNLRTVERVRTRISQWRVALSGAISGSWVGLLIGLLITDPSGKTGLVTSLTQPILIGAGVGILVNVLRFTFARNKKSFASQSMVIASEYQVQVPVNLVEQANAAVAKATAEEESSNSN